jgi:hypothetical protein
MEEKYFEKTNAAPEKPAAERLQAVIDSLSQNLPDFVLKLTASDFLRLKLEISYTEDDENADSYKVRAEKQEFQSRLKELLDEQGLELGRISGSGGERTSFFINETVVGGKTNWRRWVHYPDAVSAKAQQLLDRIAGEIGQQKGTDSYEKFTNFYREAKKRGLLTEEEYETIHHELYHAANG